LAILARLHRAPCPVGELAEQLAVSQPLVSHHLKVLRQAGLVRVRRDGRLAIHEAVPDPIVQLVLAMNPATASRPRRSTSLVMTTTEHTTHDGHDHAHGEGCGHVAVPHADHVDYVHDGHLHVAHDGHWDECDPTGHTTHDSHDHAHGEGCGHVAVPHADHVDYVHDGHRHAAHDGHWDEH
jgi:DNA-binding transcriptional ArsR family regulator